MTQWFMLTIPIISTKETPIFEEYPNMLFTIERRTTKRELRILFDKHDIKKFVVGIEKGKSGLRHYQIRLETSDPDFFNRFHAQIPQANIREAESHSLEYERKEGRFWKYDDNHDILVCRFGKPKEEQERALERLRKTNDREIVVWYDQQGKIGKSWLCAHLWENGKCYYVPPYTSSPLAMVQDLASDYIKHGWRDYVVIDIPRSWKWTDTLVTALESIKDGLIKEMRYSSETVNIRGCKVLVMTNTMPQLDALSLDRWIILNREAVQILLQGQTKKQKKKPKDKH